MQRNNTERLKIAKNQCFWGEILKECNKKTEFENLKKFIYFIKYFRKSPEIKRNVEFLIFPKMSGKNVSLIFLASIQQFFS